jgi:hypothetical protein
MPGGGHITTGRNEPSVARRKQRPPTVAVEGIRGLQVAKFRSRLARLPESFDGVYDHGPERRRVLARIAELEADDVVHLQAWELADELVPLAGLRSRFDQSGPKCFRIEGDDLIPEDYERLPNGAA